MDWMGNLLTVQSPINYMLIAFQNTKYTCIKSIQENICVISSEVNMMNLEVAYPFVYTI